MLDLVLLYIKDCNNYYNNLLFVGRSKRLVDKNILLLEQSPYKKWSLPQTYSNRVCAINEKTRRLFCSLGIWDNIMKIRAQPVKKMQVLYFINYIN